MVAWRPSPFLGAIIRATGAGWALGFGRIGGVVGPLLGGAMFGHDYNAQHIYAAAAVPAFGATVLMATLGWARSKGENGTPHGDHSGDGS